VTISQAGESSCRSSVRQDKEEDREEVSDYFYVFSLYSFFFKFMHMQKETQLLFLPQEAKH